MMNHTHTGSAGRMRRARSYCATCHPDTADCTENFFSVDGSEPGSGLSTLRGSDRIAAAIGQQCTGAKLLERYAVEAPADGTPPPACDGMFVMCAMKVARDTPPPVACR